MRVRDGDLDSLIAKFVAGHISPDEWFAQMYELLMEGHAGARALGRQRAGDVQSLGVEDFLAGRAIADGEAQFLFNFLDAIEDKDPRYWDDELDVWKPRAIQNRGRLYLHKMRGTAGQAFVSASGDEGLLDWVMAAVEHCDECPVLAGKSPWLGGELFTTPGMGMTPCRGNCKCHLVRKSDGRTSFKPVSLKA
ncbi:hypothetical protein KW797_03190 [Candidatus Parcubacteria bacterium]|nr:hypothetical protein [Candidatus Parcubacteria bacterium]